MKNYKQYFPLNNAETVIPKLRLIVQKKKMKNYLKTIHQESYFEEPSVQLHDQMADADILSSNNTFKDGNDSFNINQKLKFNQQIQ